MIKKFKNIEDSQLTITELMLPSHSNFSGKIHGGHILNLMDQIAYLHPSSTVLLESYFRRDIPEALAT